MPARATLPVPGIPDQAYFFSGGKYVRIRWKAGTSDDTIVTGPTIISEKWPALKKAGFDTVDAAIPSPVGDGVSYFFRGSKYVKVKLDPKTLQDTLLFGPENIDKYWPSLVTSGFDTVDAVIPSPVKDVLYFFSGTRYARVKLTARPGSDSADDTLLFGPAPIASNWPSLASAGIDTVDTGLANQADSSMVYAFSGARYIRMKLTHSSGTSASDVITFGPANVTDHWPSLVSAKFY